MRLGLIVALILGLESVRAHYIWDLKDLDLYLTISARHRFVQVNWRNAPYAPGDNIFITNKPPYMFEKVDGHEKNLAPLGVVPYDMFEPSTEGPIDFDPIHKHKWIVNKGNAEIVSQVTPTNKTQWFRTDLPFNYTDHASKITKETLCYALWVAYVNARGDILKTQCLKAFPTWMTNLKSTIGGFRMRDLFIPGTHDSGSYIPNFNPGSLESIVTKYAITQDEDIRGQLYHGARYLDIRVGYFKNKEHIFYITHGITRQRPLIEVVNQVRDFVLDTNEIVIFGIKEFPVGFGKDLQVHRKLVSFLHKQFAELIVDPEITWASTLNDIWRRKQNVIIAYDKREVVAEFPEILFFSVEQRWGNVKTWDRLESYLKNLAYYDRERFSSRPVADMAELTPDTWGVITDKYGGLRKLADDVNWRVSDLYKNELYSTANIVAVDFMRGTNIVELAINWNTNKTIHSTDRFY